MKKSIITMLAILVTLLGQVQAQDEPAEQVQAEKSKNKMSLQFQAGIAREGRGSMDGYYWSSNFFLPVIKGVIVSPSFSQFTYVPSQDDQENYKGSEIAVDQISLYQGKFVKERKGSIVTRLNLSLYFEPLVLFKSLDLKNHQLLIGSGARYQTGLSSITEYEVYNKDGISNAYKVKRMYTRSKRELVWQGILFQYNYHISNTLLAGLNATFIDHQENFPAVEVRKGVFQHKPSRNYMALANIGLQFGVKF